MKREKIADRLDRIEQAIMAKGHPMQDYSTLKMAMLDLIAVIRELSGKGGKDASL